MLCVVVRASLQDERLVSLSPYTSPTDLLDSAAHSNSSSPPDCNLVLSSQNRISEFSSSLTNYIASLNKLVQECKCWDVQFERNITNFFTIELNNRNEKPIYLAARRLLRHYFYHLIHHLYLSRDSVENFSYQSLFQSRSSQS